MAAPLPQAGHTGSRHFSSLPIVKTRGKPSSPCSSSSSELTKWNGDSARLGATHTVAVGPERGALFGGENSKGRNSTEPLWSEPFPLVPAPPWWGALVPAAFKEELQPSEKQELRAQFYKGP